jgi:hypothetical protein
MVPPHQAPQGDAVDAFREKLEAYRRRTRRMVAAGAGLVVALVGIGIGISWYIDPARAIQAERVRTEPIRAKFCKVLDAENARAGAGLAATGAQAGAGAPAASGVPAPSLSELSVPDAIRPLGFFSPDYDKISHENPRGNADTIELGEIA